jgi:uncharacterized protein (UPF0332 family)
MNTFLEKTNQNLSSAQILLDQSHYSSSVHCSFYGCLQTMAHTLFIKLNHNKLQFDYDRRLRKMETHQYIFALIKKEVEKSLKPEYNWFIHNYSKLKKLREQADYSEDPITHSQGYEALNMADAINNLINKLS